MSNRWRTHAKKPKSLSFSNQWGKNRNTGNEKSLELQSCSRENGRRRDVPDGEQRARERGERQSLDFPTLGWIQDVEILKGKCQERGKKRIKRGLLFLLPHRVYMCTIVQVLTCIVQLHCISVWPIRTAYLDVYRLVVRADGKVSLWTRNDKKKKKSLIELVQHLILTIDFIIDFTPTVSDNLMSIKSGPSMSQDDKNVGEAA